MKNKKTTNRKSLLHPAVITINLMLLLFLGNALGENYVSRADETTPPASADAPITVVGGTSTNKNAITSEICIFELTKFADPEFESYQTFMEENFKNKSATASLLEKGIQRYELLKKNIRGQVEILVGSQLAAAAQSGAANAAQFPGLADCEAKAAEYIDNAAKLLQMRAFTTSSIKKTSLFVEKYKQINSKLRSLDMDIMKMVINIRTFEEKMPCYLKTCI